MRQPNPIIGNSPPMREIRKLIETIADSTATVLIHGESGTGKELVAQALHFQSPRAEANFVPLNCAAIPKELMESELFGHRKGAFTGALADRVGRFELAHGGTLFLDEIGDLSLDMQVKLLRVLQERMVDPVGSSRPVEVDVRVIAATHRDLEEEIAAGRFREDLYYRLNVLPVRTPPLRERGDDIPLLLKHYAEKFAHKGAPISFSPEFLDALKTYDWPGNVRELSNLVHRFSTLFAGQYLALSAVPSAMLPKGLQKLQVERAGEETPPPA
ncbi:MAG: Nitrogen assimilation regulatory protein, partial [Pseudomonadota bacterium]